MRSLRKCERKENEMTKIKVSITEALAEANNGKLIDKKIASETQFVQQFIFRQEAVLDRLTKDGGEEKVVSAKMQSINDLFERKISILSSIKRANAENAITIHGTSRTIEEWLIIKQYVANPRMQYIRSLIQKIDEARNLAQRNGGQITDSKSAAQFSANVIVNVDETKLRDELTKLQETMDILDGQLSLKNATIKIEV